MSVSGGEGQLLNKKYLIMLGAAFFIMLATPGGRDMFGRLLPQRQRQPSRTTSVAPAPGSVATHAKFDFSAISRDLEAFNEWLNGVDVAEISVVIVETSTKITRLDPSPTRSSSLRFGVHCDNENGLVTVEKLKELLELVHDSGMTARIGSITGPDDDGNFVVKVSGVSGVGWVGLKAGMDAQAYYDVNIPGLWVVRFFGTYLLNGEWVVKYNDGDYRAGDVVPATSAGRSEYLVLDVGRDNVWLLATYNQATDGLDVPKMRWPEITGIRRANAAPHDPEAVILKNNMSLDVGQALRSPATGSQFVVERLWPNAVHFRYQPGTVGGMLDIVCVVLR